MRLIWALVRRWWHCLWHLLTFQMDKSGHGHCALTFYAPGSWLPTRIMCTCGKVFYTKPRKE